MKIMYGIMRDVGQVGKNGGVRERVALMLLMRLAMDAKRIRGARKIMSIKGRRTKAQRREDEGRWVVVYLCIVVAAVVFLVVVPVIWAWPSVSERIAWKTWPFQVVGRLTVRHTRRRASHVLTT